MGEISDRVLAAGIRTCMVLLIPATVLHVAQVRRNYFRQHPDSIRTEQTISPVRSNPTPQTNWDYPLTEDTSKGPPYYFPGWQ